MHMLAISPSVLPSNQAVEGWVVGGGRGGYRRQFMPGRISAQLACFVLALPASSNVLSHLFDLPVCVSVRRSSRPGCGSFGGLHQSQGLRHGQLVSPPTPRHFCPLLRFCVSELSFHCTSYFGKVVFRSTRVRAAFRSLGRFIFQLYDSQ